VRFVELPGSWSAIVRLVADAGGGEIAELLDAGELDELAVSRVAERRRERAASRAAAKSLALERGIVDRASRIRFTKEDARPIVMIDDVAVALHVSFSHTAGIGAAALDEAAVGLDLEREREIDPRATKFFLRDDELAAARSCAVGNALLHWWCAKEAAFKLAAGYPTLLRVPLGIERETESGLVLRGPGGARVETTRLTGGLVAALATGPDAAWSRDDIPSVSRG
jgi:phosphopantetheinyl transferase